MSNKRKFKDLTIRDNFMFTAVMMQDDNCKKFLEMDMELLEKGHKYKELPAAYVIFICDFDPFKMGKYCYTFENRCIEELALKLGDESISIVLSTEGANADSIPEELRAFLEFVKKDNPENNSDTEDAYVRQLQKSIRSVKENRMLERGFMVWIDIRDEIRDEIKDETREEVMQETILDFLKELGEISKELENTVLAETRIGVLKTMVKVAATAESFYDFEEKISNLK